MTDTITVAIGNLEHDGGDDPEGAWIDWHDYVNEAVRPDILLRQECTRSHGGGRNRLHQAEDILNGMRGYLAPPTPESPNPVGVFVNPDKVSVHREYPQVTGFWHPALVLGIGLDGIDTDFNLWAASLHLCGYDYATRAFETKRLLHFSRHGNLLIAGGDFNSYASDHRFFGEIEPVDLDEIEDPVHRILRSGADGRPDTGPDDLLHDAEMRDVARWAAEWDTEALRPTASLYKATNDRQGPRQRIDRLYVSGVLADAIMSVTVHDGERVAATTDHALVSAVLSLPKLAEAMSAQ